MKIELGKLLYKIGIDKDGKFDATLKKTEVKVKQLGKQMSKTSDRFKKFGKGLLTLKNAMIGFIAGAVVRGIGQLVKSGAELDSLSQSFNRMAGSVGQSSSEILDALRKSSAGTISNKDLMLSANKAIALGVASSTQEFTDLMKIARLKAREFGLTTTQAFNDIVTGVGRGSVMILDNLGIIIKAEEAQSIYAEALGKTTKELTINEKKEALKFAVLKAGNKAVKEAGELSLTYSDRIQRMSATQKNFTDRLGQALLPTMETVFDIFGDVSESVEESDAKFNKFSKGLYRGINYVVAFTKALGMVIKGFGRFGAIAIQSMNVVMQSMKDLGTGMYKLVTGDFKGMKEMFSKTSLEASTLKFVVGDAIDSTSDDLDSFSESMDKAKGKGFKEAVDLNAKAVHDYKKALEKAKPAVEENKKKVDEWTEAIKDAKKEASKTAKELTGKLKKSFEDFSKSIGDNLSETSKGLADIVIEAEKRRAEIKDALGKEGADKEALNSELDEVKRVLKAREDYEEEHADKIKAIKKKLADAGINPDSVGLGGNTLEDTIAEKKRVASLDEFTRFKEQQFAKLDILTNDFITEKTLYENKITHQKQLEAGFTQFLQQEVSKRQSAIQSFKMGNYASHNGVTAGSSAGVNSTSTTVNANVNVGGTVKEMNAEELSAILGFELNKHI